MATLAAFPAGEDSSSAYIYENAGGVYFWITEIKVTATEISKTTVAVVKPQESTSPVIALYVDPDAGYGLMMHLNGAFHYFTYEAGVNFNIALKT